jgi:hypothetical protein
MDRLMERVKLTTLLFQICLPGSQIRSGKRMGGPSKES